MMGKMAVFIGNQRFYKLLCSSRCYIIRCRNIRSTDCQYSQLTTLYLYSVPLLLLNGDQGNPGAARRKVFLHVEYAIWGSKKELVCMFLYIINRLNYYGRPIADGKLVHIST